MRSYRKSLVLIMLVGAIPACEEQLALSDGPTGLEPAAKPPASAIYTYTFSGDIQGELANVTASASDPFKQLTASGLMFAFPPTASGNTSICDQEQPDLAATTTDWGGYASASWSGSVDLSRRKRSAFHLQITGSQTDGAGSINLAVNDVPVEDTNSDSTAVIRFENARALISALSYSEILGDQPDYDADDRCVNFTVTAQLQP